MAFYDWYNFYYLLLQVKWVPYVHISIIILLLLKSPLSNAYSSYQITKIRDDVVKALNPEEKTSLQALNFFKAKLGNSLKMIGNFLNILHLFNLT